MKIKDPSISHHLPAELRELVKHSVTQLGLVIKHRAGAKQFNRIENIRRQMASLRGADLSQQHAILSATLSRFRSLSPEDRCTISHSFSLMLELINACENAFRSYRIALQPRFKIEHPPEMIVYVVTAHPTEARSPDNISVFHEIQHTLTEILRRSHQHKIAIQDHATHWLKLRAQLETAWQVSIARQRRPKVRDEADHIYSIVLRDETLRAILRSSSEIAPIYLRSWVGGDKDGHPGVNQVTLKESLQLSRSRLISFTQKLIQDLKPHVQRLSDKALAESLIDLQKRLNHLKVLSYGDGKRVRILHSSLNRFIRAYLKDVGVIHPDIDTLKRLVQCFPALVIPLEIRESSDLIEEAALGKPQPISRMLKELAKLSHGNNPRYYVRGFVISMASSVQHIQAANKLVKKQLGDHKLPIVPLFEQREALLNSEKILTETMKDPGIRRAIKTYWNGYLEVMLGYSDSAKESGALSSRLNIARAVHKMDRVYKKSRGIKPLFFHGSGGSTDRGGGSIEEQTNWWPKSAVERYKATIQGEMVERTFASPEITTRRFEQIASRLHMQSRSGTNVALNSTLQRLVSLVEQKYKSHVASPRFLDVIQKATPYSYLSALRIGSRPSKRTQVLQVSGLRAIPWVLCWTQTRVLFPTWWGVGSAYEELTKSPSSKNQVIRDLRKAFEQSPIFRTYMKVLSSTLARVELSVWRIYLENSSLDPTQALQTFEDFQGEFRSAVNFVNSITQKKELLWFKPWLSASIAMRSPMIHPLNLLQIVAIQNKDVRLLRDTVTGISAGMLTTG